jgi:hypothetical protein
LVRAGIVARNEIDTLEIDTLEIDTFGVDISR